MEERLQRVDLQLYLHSGSQNGGRPPFEGHSAMTGGPENFFSFWVYSWRITLAAIAVDEGDFGGWGEGGEGGGGA